MAVWRIRTIGWTFCDACARASRRSRASTIEGPSRLPSLSRRASATTHSTSVAHPTTTSGSRSYSAITATLDDSATSIGTIAELIHFLQDLVGSRCPSRR